jgi:hypothetical protein
MKLPDVAKQCYLEVRQFVGHFIVSGYRLSLT